MIHELKILPQYYEPMAKRLKMFELRKNDRGYRVGDTLRLREWDGEHYTGRQQDRYVCYILHGTGEYGLSQGYCIMGLKLSRLTVCLDGEIKGEEG